jgi:hypothetical protein
MVNIFLEMQAILERSVAEPEVCYAVRLTTRASSLHSAPYCG